MHRDKNRQRFIKRLKSNYKKTEIHICAQKHTERKGGKTKTRRLDVIGGGCEIACLHYPSLCTVFTTAGKEGICRVSAAESGGDCGVDDEFYVCSNAAVEL